MFLSGCGRAVLLALTLLLSGCLEGGIFGTGGGSRNDIGTGTNDDGATAVVNPPQRALVQALVSDAHTLLVNGVDTGLAVSSASLSGSDSAVMVAPGMMLSVDVELREDDIFRVNAVHYRPLFEGSPDSLDVSNSRFSAQQLTVHWDAATVIEGSVAELTMAATVSVSGYFSDAQTLRATRMTVTPGQWTDVEPPGGGGQRPPDGSMEPTESEPEPLNLTVFVTEDAEAMASELVLNGVTYKVDPQLALGALSAGTRLSVTVTPSVPPLLTAAIELRPSRWSMLPVGTHARLAGYVEAVVDDALFLVNGEPIDAAAFDVVPAPGSFVSVDVVLEQSGVWARP